MLLVKAPPSIPNRPPKLGSKVQAMAAGMFGAPGSTDSDKPRSHPAIPPKPNKPILAPKPPINIGGGGAASKVSALRASLSKDLGNMFSRGGVPPPSMAAIVTGIKEESDEEGLDGDEINERALKNSRRKLTMRRRRKSPRRLQKPLLKVSSLMQEEAEQRALSVSFPLLLFLRKRMTNLQTKHLLFKHLKVGRLEVK